jgi:hypothetical protein
MSNFKTELKQSQNDFFSNVKKKYNFKTSQNDCAKVRVEFFQGG